LSHPSEPLPAASPAALAVLIAALAAALTGMAWAGMRPRPRLTRSPVWLVKRRRVLGRKQ